jgi:hypothetical protein
LPGQSIQSDKVILIDAKRELRKRVHYLERNSAAVGCPMKQRCGSPVECLLEKALRSGSGAAT